MKFHIFSQQSMDNTREDNVTLSYNSLGCDFTLHF